MQPMHTMQLISVNVGKPTPVITKSGLTGIYKRPSDAPVYVGPFGLTGDNISDIKHHGGLDQAVYVFGMPDYAWWSAELDKVLEPATFGENLTLTGLESAAYNTGDRLHFDEVVLEITGARVPCVTLAARMGDPGFVRRFRHAERPGLYCRVLKTGYISAGETVTVERYAGPTVNVLEGFRLWFRGHPTEEEIQRMLAAPIDIRSRRYFEEELASLRQTAALQ